MGLALGVIYLQISFIIVAILSGLIGISVYSCGELRKAASERKIDMKKIVIIVALAIILFITPQQDAEQPSMTALETSETAVTEQTEETLFITEETTETNCEQIPGKNEVSTKDERAVQKIPMKERTENNEKPKSTEQEETVECIDDGNQSLGEYKPQPSGQTNPFENAPSANIVDQPVEDLIGEGEDRPGEGKHF